MSKSSKAFLRVLLSGAALSVFGAIGPSAEAQTVEEPFDSEEIVVTGTNIRGVAPTGANVLTLSEQAVTESGATSANGVLATVPQVTSNFNRVRALPAGASGITNLAPSIRNFGAGGGTTTLVLMDGHRFVNAGVLSTSPDPDVMPPGVIERVDVIPDGGSAIYGSDAVGGVINFVTRKSYDGVGGSGHYGVADDYETYDFDVIAGRDWTGGSGYLAYGFLHNTSIFGRDRDYVQQVNPNVGTCGLGTVFQDQGAGPISFALPDRVPGTITTCDNTDDLTLYPEQTRNSIFGGLTQDITSNITFDLRAFFTRRESRYQEDLHGDNQGRSVTICQTSAGCPGVVYPGYVPLPGDTGVQTVRYSYAGALSGEAPNTLEEFQVTPTLSIDLNDNWQLRLLGAFGRSTTDTHTFNIDAGSEASAIAAGLINPYDARSSSPTGLAMAYRPYVGRGEQTLTNFRAIADGALFSLPGGDVRLAAGLEHSREAISDVVFTPVVPGTNPSTISGERTVSSVFAEVAAPIVGVDNEMPLVHALSLSLSGRYDDYSDFGSTFNPRVGITYEPTSWLRVRGNWGQSFNAPSLADTNAPDTRSFALPPVLPNPAGPAPGPFDSLVVLVGGNSGLGPQEADTWSVGFDVEPPAAPGLRFSLTYYDVALTNQIAIPPLNLQIYTSPFAEYVIMQPSLAQVQAAIGSIPYLGLPLATLYGTDREVYALLDFRRQNLGEVNQNGIDFAISYTHDMSFGSIDASLVGTRTLKRDISAAAGTPFTDALDSPGASNLSYALQVGATAGPWRASVSWNHSEGYDLNPSVVSARFGAQTHVDSFDTADLFVQYSVGGENLLKDVAFTLNVANVLDEDPPFFNGNDFAGAPGYTNGSTLGRLVTLGVSKRF